MIAKVKWIENGTGELREIAVTGGLLEGLEFVQNARITGAKINTHGDSWIDVDSFMEAGREMFAPISEEEAARREAEWNAAHPNGLVLTLMEYCKDGCGKLVEAGTECECRLVKN